MSSTPRPPETSTTADDDRPVRRVGLAIVVGVFGVFGAWASLAPLDSAALAPGVITVETYRKTVQHLEGGIIRSLEVRDGDAVRKGQTLATLDDTQTKAQLEVLRGQYYVAATREARLVAQRDELPAIRYPADLLAQRADPRVQDAMRMQTQTFAVRKASHE